MMHRTGGKPAQPRPEPARRFVLRCPVDDPDDGPLYWLEDFGWGTPRTAAQRFDVIGPVIEGVWELAPTA